MFYFLNWWYTHHQKNVCQKRTKTRFSYEFLGFFKIYLLASKVTCSTVTSQLPYYRLKTKAKREPKWRNIQYERLKNETKLALAQIDTVFPALPASDILACLKSFLSFFLNPGELKILQTSFSFGRVENIADVKLSSQIHIWMYMRFYSCVKD